MKNIQDIDINGKTVILRCDFNVPLKDGQVDDDSKITGKIIHSNSEYIYLIEEEEKYSVESFLNCKNYTTKDYFVNLD